MSSNTTILITGANRGLGRGFLEQYISRPNYTVIAGVRDVENATTKSLASLPKGSGTSLITVKIDSASNDDAATAIKELETVHGINKLDVVIANAGISKVYPRVSELKTVDLLEHIQVNAIAVVYLFQAVLPLLDKAANPKFVAISSSAATMGNMADMPVPNAAYGTSKAALNYLMCKIHFEHPNMVVIPMCPGWAQTDMGNYGARAFGLEKAEITVDESVNGVVKVIDAATREEMSGKFMRYNGDVQLW